jgi:hypothetical protein
LKAFPTTTTTTTKKGESYKARFRKEYAIFVCCLHTRYDEDDIGDIFHHDLTVPHTYIHINCANFDSQIAMYWARHGRGHPRSWNY